MKDTCPFNSIHFEIMKNNHHITPRTLEEETGEGYNPITVESMLIRMECLYKFKKEMDESLRRAVERGYDGTGQ